MEKRYITFAIFATIIVILAPTLMSLPPVGANVILVTDKKIYHQGETVTVTLENRGSQQIYFDLDYKVEVYLNGSWTTCKKLTSNLGLLILLIQRPGGSYTWKINLDKISPGYYRVVKEVWTDSSLKHNETITTEFAVIENNP